MVIRCTAKMLKLLGVRPSSLAELEPDEDDWYVNLLWFEGRKCLLLTHAGTAFSVFVPDVRKSDLESLGPFLVDAIIVALDAENLSHEALGDLDGLDARVSKTASRRVLGVMNDVSLHVDCSLDRFGSVLDVDVVTVNRWLQRTLHSHGGGRVYATPLELVAERARQSRG